MIIKILLISTICYNFLNDHVALVASTNEAGLACALIEMSLHGRAYFCGHMGVGSQSMVARRRDSSFHSEQAPQLRF
jgi:hypothetical protein